MPKINMHKCGICGNEVNPNGGMHGPTGDHWACFDNQNKQLQEKVLKKRVELLQLIANQYAPNRAKGINDGELLNICDEYLTRLVKAKVV